MSCRREGKEIVRRYTEFIKALEILEQVRQLLAKRDDEN